MEGIKLNVNGEIKLSTELKYEDLVILTKQYVDIHGKMPTCNEMRSENNLPQQRIFSKLRRDAGVTYHDFCWLFGKYMHVRADINEYDLYIKKFKEIGLKNGRAISSNKLCNSEYRLPSSQWLVKNCPDKSVKNYGDFIRWCGLKEPKHIFTKSEVRDILYKKELELKRPITRNDISTSQTGFSMIVVNRLFGSLGSAKEELGLMRTEGVIPILDKKVVTLKEKVSAIEVELSAIINDYKLKTGLSYITWSDIESGQYAGISLDHKVVNLWFDRVGKSVRSFIKSNGCELGRSTISNRELLSTGEYVESSLEYKVTMYLNECGFEYGKDYNRAVKYSEFSKEESNINCDYVIQSGNGTFYLEVCGMILGNHGDWKDTCYRTEVEETYRLKTVYKENVLLNNNLTYLFLFPEDFKDNTYQHKLKEMLFRTSHTARCA